MWIDRFCRFLAGCTPRSIIKNVQLAEVIARVVRRARRRSTIVGVGGNLPLADVPCTAAEFLLVIVARLVHEPVVEIILRLGVAHRKEFNFSRSTLALYRLRLS